MRNVYEQIETTVGEALDTTLKLAKENDPSNGQYLDSDEINAVKKGMLLSMQGAWLARTSTSWGVTNSTCSDDADGPTHMTRKNVDDGTTRFMCRRFLLGNHTMFFIGLIALNKEQFILARLAREILKCLAYTPRGGCVDCLYYDEEQKAEIVILTDNLKHPDGTAIWQAKELDRVAPKSALQAKRKAICKSIWMDHEKQQPENARIFRLSLIHTSRCRRSTLCRTRCSQPQ